MKETGPDISTARSASILTALIFACLVSVAVVFSSISFYRGAVSLTEEGILEQATAFLYIIAIFACLFHAVRNDWRTGYSCAFMLNLPLIRELDYHKLFTAASVTSKKYWKSMDIPYSEKIIVALILLPMILAVIIFLRSMIPRFKADILRRKPHAISIVGMFVFLMISQILDSAIDTQSLTTPLELFFYFCEESLEFGLPLMIIIASIQRNREPSG